MLKEPCASSSASSAHEMSDAALSRANTHESALTELGEPLDASSIVTTWSLRSPRENSAFLRESFRNVVNESAALPPDQRLIMYDACDDQEIAEQMGPCFRKRMDARRNTKPKKPDAQLLVCTPFDPASFNFSKIKNPREKLLKLRFSMGANYEVLTNKFPLFPGHMLLVACHLVPQQMRHCHLLAIAELLQGCSGFCAYFNSWCASASVNHFHCHLVDEQPPVTRYPLVPGPHVLGQRCLQPEGFPGFCFVFEMTQLGLVDEVVRAMQADNQPHNFLFTSRHIYLFPKPLQRPERSFELYPETVGGPELLGSFTVYQGADYDALTLETAEELTRMNTAPLPSRLMHRGSDQTATTCTAMSCDDLAQGTISLGQRTPGQIPSSRSVQVVRTPGMSQRIMTLPGAVCAA